MRWDIFCQVIDNHGDLGVCWRLACDLARRGEQVRLWLDDPAAGAPAAALDWMAPGGQPGVEVGPWPAGAAMPAPGDVVIEAFGCELPPGFVARMAQAPAAPRWINLEYLTAEGYAERSHGLPSPVLAGPGAGLTKRFFYPGFTAATGGLLREPDLLQRQADFDRGAWLQQIGVAGPGRTVSLFCYEPPALAQLLQRLRQAPAPTRLLVTAGRAAAAVRAAHAGHADAGAAPGLAIHYLPLLPQREYDHLLWACDFNFVRGEDSVVRALWAGRPFAWQIYPQQDAAHHAKLDAFLDWLQAPPSLRRFHAGWNGIETQLPALSAQALAEWAGTVGQARARLLAQDDLTTQLLRQVRAPAG